MVKSLFCGFLRGFAQVMFQSGLWSGILFLIGIVWGSLVMDRPQMMIGAIIGCIIPTIIGAIMGRRDVTGGLCGFNGVLVGCALPLFLPSQWWMWVMVAAGSTTTRYIRNLFTRCGITSLTMPFVLITWLLLLLGKFIDATQVPIYQGALELNAVTAVSGIVKGISEVFLIDSFITGLLFIAALVVGNWRAAVWAVIGSAIGLAVAAIAGTAAVTLIDGLWGFSPALTAVALGSMTEKFNLRIVTVTVAGVMATVLIQYLLGLCLAPLSLPVLTAPFCIATWATQRLL